MTSLEKFKNLHEMLEWDFVWVDLGNTRMSTMLEKKLKDYGFE
jgi:hypothetical protein